DALAIPVIDLYVHAWDLGAAVSINVEIPADVIDFAHACLDPLPDEVLRGDNRAFGPQTPVPDGGTPTERFIAWTGRQLPQWSAAAGRTARRAGPDETRKDS